jgi:hypothetical protein
MSSGPSDSRIDGPYRPLDYVIQDMVSWHTVLVGSQQFGDLEGHDRIIKGDGWLV